MLTEYSSVKQDKGEVKKRWFGDKYFDLILWQDKGGKIVKFELCYDKEVNERALTWSEESGFSHLKVDDGESETGRYKMSPILVADGIFDYKKIAEKFLAQCQSIDEAVSQFVYTKILNYSSF